MKESKQKVYTKWLNVNETKAGESFDVGNILTSPVLLQAVGLPARRYDKKILPQTGKDVKNERDTYLQGFGSNCALWCC